MKAGLIEPEKMRELSHTALLQSKNQMNDEVTKEIFYRYKITSSHISESQASSYV